MLASLTTWCVAPESSHRLFDLPLGLAMVEAQRVYNYKPHSVQRQQRKIITHISSNTTTAQTQNANQHQLHHISQRQKYTQEPARKTRATRDGKRIRINILGLQNQAALRCYTTKLTQGVYVVMRW